MENIFVKVDPEFYETLSVRPLDSDYVEQLRQLVPATWVLERGDIWMHARRPADWAASPVMQGFKIHVSCGPNDVHQLLDIVVPTCVPEETDFKIAGDPTLLHILNAKLYPRGSSGKFMTIYPTDEEAFKSLIERLHQDTKDVAVGGPYVLSDRRYKDSKVLSYRYGGFRPAHRVNIDGTHDTFLVSPEGEYVRDERLPYFSLPDWVRDPFDSDRSDEPPASVTINGRYLIEEALGFSNAGGIYKGTDAVTGRPVLVKEARPYTNYVSFQDRVWDATDLLEREFAMLTRLGDLRFVTTPIDFFREWEHAFLVEEWVQGVSLYQYFARDDIILAPFVRRPGRVERWVPKFKHVALTLIEILTAIHARGVLLGDLSPRNVLINPETREMWIIDLESAVHADDDPDVLMFATRWATPGFLHPARNSRNELVREDDLYAAAMILYSSVVPVTALFNLNPAAEEIFLDRFIALGVPREVGAIITSFLQGDLDDARAILKSWDCPEYQTQ
jgi:hypothetical protein